MRSLLLTEGKLSAGQKETTPLTTLLRSLKGVPRQSDVLQILTNQKYQIVLKDREDQGRLPG